MPNTVIVKWDELVFRGRNRSYGAYVLRRCYQRHTLTGLLIATLLAFGVTLGPQVYAYFAPAPVVEKPTPVRKINYDALQQPPLIQEERVPEPPRMQMPKPPPRAQVQFVIPEVVEAEEAESERLITQDELNRENFAITTQQTDTAGLSTELSLFPSGDGTEVPDEIVEQGNTRADPDEFVAVEREPSPVNMDAIRRQIGYPETARQASLEGTVVLRIYVNKYGTYEEHIVLSSSSPTFTRAVEAHVGKLRFTPGIQAQQPIGVWVNIPFTFKLNQ